ncbi:glycine oxidase ThiO [Corynebacterium occultum]|nr:glycine oxidase ThiO [Corynebacterium occultum]
MIVIGGGLVGLVTCFELSEQGFQVTLIDPEPASGATHYAGGMLAPIAEVQYRQEALFPLMLQAAALYPDLIERVSRASASPIDYRPRGTLVVAADRADARHLQELGDYQRLHGMSPVELSVTRARRLEPALSPRISGAVSIPDDHQVSPRLFAAALLDVLKQRGVKIIRERVRHLEGADPCLAVHTETQVIETGDAQVILANGLGAAQVSGWYTQDNPLQLRPVYGDIMNLRVPEYLRPLSERVIRGFVEDRPVYLIPRSDGTLTLGASSRENDSALPNVGAVHELLRDGIRLLPGLEECELLEVGVGARPGTPDDLPYLGRVGRNLIISTGYFRHGILLSALGAHAVVDLLLGKKLPAGVDLTACDPWRHVGGSAPAAHSGAAQHPGTPPF